MGASLDAFLQHYYAFRPVNATFTGVHKYDGHLPNWSPDGLDSLLQDMRSVRAKMHVEASSDRNSDEGLATSFLDIQSAEIESRHFHRGNPSLHLGEAIFGVIGLMLRDFASTEERAVGVVSRLKHWPSFFENIRHSVSAAGLHPTWAERTLRECLGAERLLMDGVPTWARMEELSVSIRSDLATAAREAGKALRTFSLELESWVGGSTTPRCGPDFLDLVLRRGHRIEQTRADLLDEARVELVVAKDRLFRLARAADDRGVEGVRERLASIHPAASQYLDAFGELWRDCRAVSETKRLCTWPDDPIRYRRIPDWARSAAPYLYFLFYRSPPPFDVLPSVDYLVPDANDDGQRRVTNMSVIKQNHVVHHGAIGHHVQNGFAYRCESPIGKIAAVDCATRIGMFLAGTMAEGWACYATDLMEEVGFLTPLEAVSLQENRVKQLVRAMADIDLHQGGMSVNEGVIFFAEQASMTHEAAQNEICKISMFPGTGMMYWFGAKRIHELRAQCAMTDGGTFSMQRFHDQLLTHGSIPVNVSARRLVEERVA